MDINLAPSKLPVSGDEILGHHHQPLKNLVEQPGDTRPERTKSSFERLPREIRDRIYGMVMVYPGYINPRAEFRRGRRYFIQRPALTQNLPPRYYSGEWPFLSMGSCSAERSNESAYQALFVVSKDIGQEAMEIYYNRNRFLFPFTEDLWDFFKIINRGSCRILSLLRTIILEIYGDDLDDAQRVESLKQFPSLRHLVLYIPYQHDSRTGWTWVPRRIQETNAIQALLTLRGIRTLDIREIGQRVYREKGSVEQTDVDNFLKELDIIKTPRA